MAEIYNCQYKWDDKKYEVTFERKKGEYGWQKGHISYILQTQN